MENLAVNDANTLKEHKSMRKKGEKIRKIESDWVVHARRLLTTKLNKLLGWNTRRFGEALIWIRMSETLKRQRKENCRNQKRMLNIMKFNLTLISSPRACTIPYILINPFPMRLKCSKFYFLFLCFNFRSTRNWIPFFAEKKSIDGKIIVAIFSKKKTRKKKKNKKTFELCEETFSLFFSLRHEKNCQVQFCQINSFRKVKIGFLCAFRL